MGVSCTRSAGAKVTDEEYAQVVHWQARGLIIVNGAASTPGPIGEEKVILTEVGIRMAVTGKRRPLQISRVVRLLTF